MTRERPGRSWRGPPLELLRGENARTEPFILRESPRSVGGLSKDLFAGAGLRPAGGPTGPPMHRGDFPAKPRTLDGIGAQPRPELTTNGALVR